MTADPNDRERARAGDAVVPEGGEVAEEARPADAGGGVSIGRMTGGAVAGGYRATAEDRSERVGSWEAPAGGDVSRPPVPPSSSGVSVGTMAGGAVAAGREARAVDASRRLISASPELVGSLEVLRSQLPLLARTQGDGIDEVAGQLAAIEGEIANGGQTERHRLERLRTLLTGGGTVAGGLASALAVVQSITQMLG